MKPISTEEVEAGYAALKTMAEKAVTLSESDIATWHHFKECSQVCFYRKKDLMVRTGERSETWGYMVKGAAKSYYISPIDGRQVITRLHIPNDFCITLNFHLGEPAAETIEFVSDSWLINVSYTDIMTMQANLPDYSRIYSTLVGQRSRMQEEKIRDLQMLTVAQRLEKLMATTPQYFNYFPIADIASYLGTERETLTRLRSKLYK